MSGIIHLIFTLSPCSGIVISGYSKTSTEKSFINNLAKAIKPYKNFKKMYKVDTRELGGKKELSWFKKINLIYLLRIWFWVEIEICKDSLLCYNIWQNHQGQGSQVCGHVVSYWRNNGTPHWVFNYQWSGDCLFCNQDHPQSTQR